MNHLGLVFRQEAICDPRLRLPGHGRRPKARSRPSLVVDVVRLEKEAGTTLQRLLDQILLARIEGTRPCVSSGFVKGVEWCLTKRPGSRPAFDAIPANSAKVAGVGASVCSTRAHPSSLPRTIVQSRRLLEVASIYSATGSECRT